MFSWLYYSLPQFIVKMPLRRVKEAGGKRRKMRTSVGKIRKRELTLLVFSIMIPFSLEMNRRRREQWENGRNDDEHKLWWWYTTRRTKKGINGKKKSRNKSLLRISTYFIAPVTWGWLKAMKIGLLSIRAARAVKQTSLSEGKSGQSAVECETEEEITKKMKMALKHF